MKSKKNSFIFFFALLGIIVFFLLLDTALPTSSLESLLTRKQAFEVASKFIASQGSDLSGYSSSTIFADTPKALAYLQKNKGVKEADRIIKKDSLPVWRWWSRWFKSLEKEEFNVSVDPSTGRILYYNHLIKEDAPGANLSQTEAKLIAEKFLGNVGINLNEYDLKESSTKKMEARTEHIYEWEKKDYKIEDARYIVKVRIQGDKVGFFDQYLKPPENFIREYEKESSKGMLLSLLSFFFTFLIILSAFIVIIRHRHNLIRWRFGIIPASCLISLSVVSFLNSLTILWSGYPTTMSKNIFLAIMLIGVVVGACIYGLIIVLTGTAGEYISRKIWGTKFPLIDALMRRDFSSPQITYSVLTGYSLAFIFLGYLAIFYFIGSKFFHIWVPAGTRYSNILGTRLPFLMPLTVSVVAAISEEFTYRLFTISFLKKFLKSSFVSVFLSALIWGFAHSNYVVFPVYIRGIELTMAGVLLGFFYIKFGIEVVVIAHYVIDAVLVGLPLLRSHNLYYIGSGVAVVGLALLPLILAGAMKARRQK